MTHRIADTLDGQPYRKHGVARGGPQRDVAVVLRDGDAVGDVEAQSAALTHVPGREERLEDA